MEKTVAVLLKEAKQALQKANIDTYILDANILLQEALGISREELIKDPQRIVSGVSLIHFHAMLAKRLSAEPIAYIIGKKEFYGREFKVSSATLIPRPDSEILIDTVLKHTRFLSPNAIKIADFGTGSGCLVLTLLAEIEAATGVAVDVSPAAIEIARQNAEKLGLAKRVEFRINNWLEEKVGEAFDIIVSNPPYIKNEDISGLHPSVVHYEPHKALDGGLDGLECYRQLAQIITPYLKPGGMVFLECGLGQHQEVVDIFNQQGFKLVSFEKDLAGIYRCIVMH